MLICNDRTGFSNCVWVIYLIGVIAAITMGGAVREMIADHRSVTQKEQSVREFADGGEIKPTRFPYSWVVKKADGSIWWFDSLGGEGAEKINKELLWKQ